MMKQAWLVANDALVGWRLARPRAAAVVEAAAAQGRRRLFARANAPGATTVTLERHRNLRFGARIRPARWHVFGDRAEAGPRRRGRGPRTARRRCWPRTTTDADRRLLRSGAVQHHPSSCESRRRCVQTRQRPRPGTSRVRDNTQSECASTPWSRRPSPPAPAAAHARPPRALRLGRHAATASTRVAAPFAVLDTVYTAQAKVLSVAPDTAFPTLRVFWSVNNVPATGNPSAGADRHHLLHATDASRPRRSTCSARRTSTPTNTTPRSIAHEWGHYYQSAFSRDDSPGGSHSLVELRRPASRLFRRLGQRLVGHRARAHATTPIRSRHRRRRRASNLDLDGGTPASTPGWYREASIQSILWKLNKQVGFKPIHDALTGRRSRTAAAVTSIHPFAAAFDAVAPGSAVALDRTC